MSTIKDALPQYDRSKIKTDIGFYSTLFRLLEVGKEFIVPAIVTEYERKTGIATVKPLPLNVYDTVSGEETVERKSYSVPVLRFLQGGVTIDTPIYNGSTGYLFSCDRNCKTVIKNNSTILLSDDNEDDPANKGPQRPDDNSLSRFENGFFIPFSWGKTDIDDDDGLIIRKDSPDGKSVEIKVLKDKVLIRKCLTNDGITDIQKSLTMDDSGVELIDSDSGIEISGTKEALCIKKDKTTSVNVKNEIIEAKNSNFSQIMTEDSVSILNKSNSSHVEVANDKVDIVSNDSKVALADGNLKLSRTYSENNVEKTDKIEIGQSGITVDSNSNVSIRKVNGDTVNSSVVITDSSVTSTCGSSSSIVSNSSVTASYRSGNINDSIEIGASGLRYNGQIDSTVDVVTSLAYQSYPDRLSFLRYKTTPMSYRGDMIVAHGQESAWKSLNPT